MLFLGAMTPTSSISEDSVRGFALAAILSHDRGAERAAPGLAGATRERWLTAATTLQRAPRKERARALAAWTRDWRDRQGPLISATGLRGLNPRALAAVAGRLPPDSDAPPPDLIRHMALRLRVLLATTEGGP